MPHPQATASADHSQKKCSSTMSEVVKELRKIGDICIPVMGMSLITYLKNMTLVMFMGQLGSLELAGGALAIGFTNITGYSVLSGLSMGMEPLCSQAFGSKNHTILRTTLFRTILMLLVASLPISLLWLNIKPLLLCLHQDPEIVELAAVFCRFTAPDLIALSFLHPLRIYLRCQGITWPLMWCNLLSVALHFPITYAMTFVMELRVHGLAISTFVADFITLFSLIIYLSINANANANKHSKQEDLLVHTHLIDRMVEPLTDVSDSQAESTGLISMSKDWITLLKFSVLSCLGVCLEWWWYELMTLFAGYLHNPRVTLATSAILIQTTSLLYTLPNALSSAASTRVGTELGAHRVSRARHSTAVVTTLSALVSVLGLMWTTLGKEIWARVFTDDPEILELTITVLPLVGLCELANCPQTTSCGVLRGCARTGVGAVINFLAFYMVGGPVALGLGFVMGFRLVGLYYGLLAAQVVCLLGLLIVLRQIDWEMESARAADLVGWDLSGDLVFNDVEQGDKVCKEVFINV